jgi:hypothetical protein
MFTELRGSTVVSINGDTLELSIRNGAARLDVDRKYLCCSSDYDLGHCGSPCWFCGYDGPEPQ